MTQEEINRFNRLFQELWAGGTAETLLAIGIPPTAVRNQLPNMKTAYLAKLQTVRDELAATISTESK